MNEKTREPMVIALATGKGGSMKAASATFPFQKCPFKEIKIPIPSESARDQNGTTASRLRPLYRFERNERQSESYV